MLEHHQLTVVIKSSSHAIQWQTTQSLCRKMQMSCPVLNALCIVRGYISASLCRKRVCRPLVTFRRAIEVYTNLHFRVWSTRSIGLCRRKYRSQGQSCHSWSMQKVAFSTLIGKLLYMIHTRLKKKTSRLPYNQKITKSKEAVHPLSAIPHPKWHDWPCDFLEV